MWRGGLCSAVDGGEEARTFLIIKFLHMLGVNNNVEMASATQQKSQQSQQNNSIIKRYLPTLLSHLSTSLSANTLVIQSSSSIYIQYVSQPQRPILYTFFFRLGICHLQRGSPEQYFLRQSSRTRRSTEHYRGGD